MNRHTLFLLFSMLFLVSKMHGQINPPDFICTENDTLKWDLPINNCGPFISYDIYYSDNINGPYDLLINITDPNSTSYYHINANSSNNVWYYYIVSNHNCPDEAIIYSDTLDNLDVDFPPIDAVTVVGNHIEIYWTMSQAAETAGYIIYQETNNGSFNPIDTVFPETTTSYTHTAVDPSSATENYTIQAIDACGNTSIFNTAPQSSMLLQVEDNACTQSALLSWSLYKNWAEGIDNQEIWVSIDGAPPILAGETPATDTTYIYENLDDGVEYCFVLRANRKNSSYFSSSNERCLIANIIQPNRNLGLQSVSFTENNELELIWNWDNNAEINSVSINSALDNSNYSSVQSFPPTFPLNSKDTVYITEHNANYQPQFFQISTIDDCDSTNTSNYAATLFLSGEARADFTNSLQWTAFDIENSQLIEYRLYKKTATNDAPIAILTPSDQGYIDAIDIDNFNEANACYYIIAYATAQLPNGSAAYTFSRSNTICLTQFSTIQFPNAFAPKGKNNTFKPKVIFPHLISSYELKIFDRWGKMIHLGQQYDQGWNGQHNGKIMNAGTYIYQMKVVQTNGEINQQSGTVTLIK